MGGRGSGESKAVWGQEDASPPRRGDVEVTVEESKTLMKMGDPGDPAFQSASVAVSPEFCIQNNFKAAE
ncbi:hypothetical protein STEG23_016799 [Scotinomys teguina]